MNIDECVRKAVMNSVPSRQTEIIQLLREMNKKMDEILALIKEGER